MIEGVLACGLLAVCGVFCMVFTVMRRAHRQRRRARLDPGFYPATRDLGNALHTLQIMARPEIAHVMQVKTAEPAEDEESGAGKG